MVSVSVVTWPTMTLELLFFFFPVELLLILPTQSGLRDFHGCMKSCFFFFVIWCVILYVIVIVTECIGMVVSVFVFPWPGKNSYADWFLV